MSLQKQTIFFYSHLDNNCKSTIIFYFIMTPFYALIYTLAYSESYTVAQQPSHRYVYFSIIFYNCSYTKTFKTL